MTDKIEEILRSFGYRVNSVETDFSIDRPLVYHFSAEGVAGAPSEDTTKIVSEIKNHGFDCMSISCRKEVDTHEQWTVGSRVPEIMQGMIHYYLDVAVIPHVMPSFSAAIPVVEDSSFNLSGAL